MKHTYTFIARFFFKILLTNLIFSCPVHYSYCQLLTNENAAITILPGTQLTVEGDVQNQNGTTFTNNGTIDLSGNWIHNAANNAFGTSAGTVIFNGTNQTIRGISSTLFNNLTLQGTGTKTLLINTSVGGSAAGGVLNIGSRNLILNSKSLTVTNSATAAIAFSTGIITSEQIDNSSKVIWNINAAAGAHTIPFGNTAGVRIPFTYDLTSGNAGIVTASTYPTAANNTPLPISPTIVTHVRNNQGVDNSANTVDRFWQIDVTGAPAAAMTFSWAVSENAANGNINPRAQRWNAPFASWETPLTGQVNPTTQSVTVSNVTTFGPWAVALSASPLPIQLISFDAEAVNNESVLCKWITASEINNDYFTVERSADGHEFEGAGIIEGAGNSTSVLNYSFTDEHPYNGTSYYRLRQTDFNGTYSYSNVVPVNINKAFIADFMVYPNPAHDQFTAEFASENEQEASLVLYDVTGRKVLSENFISAAGINTKKMEVSKISNGVYFIEMTSGTTKNTVRLVKK